MSTSNVSPEFASLTTIRASLKASIAARDAVPGQSADFRTVTDLERGRVLEVESRMRALDVAAFQAIQDAESAAEKSAAKPATITPAN